MAVRTRAAWKLITSWVTSPGTSRLPLGAPDVRRDRLLDQPDLTVGRHLEGPQMAPVNAVLGQSPGGDRQREGVPAVVGGAAPGSHDLGSLQLAQRGLGQTARLQQLLAGQPDRLLGALRPAGSRSARRPLEPLPAGALWPTHTRAEPAHDRAAPGAPGSPSAAGSGPAAPPAHNAAARVTFGVAAVARRRPLRSDQPSASRNRILEIEMSGKSVRRIARTWPMLRVACRGRVSVTSAPGSSAPRARASAGRAGRRLGRVRHDAEAYPRP